MPANEDTAMLCGSAPGEMVARSKSGDKRPATNDKARESTPGEGGAPAGGERTTHLNVGLLVGGAVAVFLWNLYFSAWTWGLWAAVPFGIAFLDRVAGKVPKVGEDVSKAIARVLTSRATTAVLLLLLLAAAVASQFFGAVQVVSAEPGTAEARRVELHRAGTAPEADAIDGGGTLRWTLRTAWTDPVPVAVQTAGQEVELEVLPWHRPSVRIADRFAQPVLLVLPSLPLVDATNTLEGGAEVEVRHGGERWSGPYTGESLLLGCGETEICIPDAALRRHLEERLAQRPGLHFRRLLDPRRIGVGALAGSEPVTVEVRFGAQPLASGRFTVAPAAGPMQREDLDVLP
jgi:hypothetical protein